MPPESDDASRRERSEQALGRLEDRVRHVRHLHPFEVSVRDDGRFRCQLGTPVSQLTPDEALAVADALEELAELVRDSVDG